MEIRETFEKDTMEAFLNLSQNRRHDQMQKRADNEIGREFVQSGNVNGGYVPNLADCNRYRGFILQEAFYCKGLQRLYRNFELETGNSSRRSAGECFGSRNDKDHI